ncbi:MAG: dihydroorotase family protein, partial [Candidatus Deferrimicrobiaceae bacterium]
DHAPHDEYTKRCEFVAASNGIIGLETALPLSMALLAGGKVTPARLVELLSAIPARILGLKEKGTLRKGADGDVTIVDPEAEWEFRESDVRSKSRNSPFFGWKMRGRAVVVLCRGRLTHSLGKGVSPDA